jgi:hypothetical protein
MDQCRKEIAAIELEFARGNPDKRGLNLGWLDWQVELLICKEKLYGTTQNSIGSRRG